MVLRSCLLPHQAGIDGTRQHRGTAAAALVLPDSGWAQNDPTRRQLSERAQTIGMPFIPDIEVETGAAALAIAASGTAAAVAFVPVAEALGYTSRLNYVSLDPPLIETFAIISRDPASLSPATQAMIKLAEEHMRTITGSTSRRRPGLSDPAGDGGAARRRPFSICHFYCPRKIGCFVRLAQC